MLTGMYIAMRITTDYNDDDNNEEHGHDCHHRDNDAGDQYECRNIVVTYLYFI